MTIRPPMAYGMNGAMAIHTRCTATAATMTVRQIAQIRRMSDAAHSSSGSASEVAPGAPHAVGELAFAGTPVTRGFFHAHTRLMEDVVDRQACLMVLFLGLVEGGWCPASESEDADDDEDDSEEDEEDDHGACLSW